MRPGRRWIQLLRALMVGCVLALAGQAHLGHVGSVRAEDDAVAQRLVTELQWLKEGRKLLGHALLLLVVI